MEGEVAPTKEARRVFVSYSSVDRSRINGLGLLLESLGHGVFIDHRTILPGRRWRAELQNGIKECDVLVVFWTRHSATSDWVRKEYEYFHAHHPERLLIPVLGDETPLAELLKARQATDFAPIVNELLEMQRKMKSAGADRDKIRAAILERLKEAGIELDEKQQRKFFLIFGTLWFPGILGALFLLLRRLAANVLESSAQLSLTQIALVALSGVFGVTLCQLHEHGIGPLAASRRPPAVAERGQILPADATAPTKGCRVFFTGLLVSDVPDRPKWSSEAFVLDSFSEYVGSGSYHSNREAFPKSIAATFDGIAIDDGTQVEIFSEENFQGEKLLDVKGPAIINNSKYSDRKAEFHTKDFKPSLQEIFPQRVRQWSETDMHKWADGSLRITCED